MNIPETTYFEIIQTPLLHYGTTRNLEICLNS